MTIPKCKWLIMKGKPLTRENILSWNESLAKRPDIFETIPGDELPGVAAVESPQIIVDDAPLPDTALPLPPEVKPQEVIAPRVLGDIKAAEDKLRLAERQQKIMFAFTLLKKRQFTPRGLPKVDAVSHYTGIQGLTRKEVTDLWNEHLESKKGGKK